MGIEKEVWLCHGYRDQSIRSALSASPENRWNQLAPWVNPGLKFVQKHNLKMLYLRRSWEVVSKRVQIYSSPSTTQAIFSIFNLK